METKFPCPVCKSPDAEMTFNTMDIPHFGEVMESTALCQNCKWRHVDVLVLKQDKARRYTLKIEERDDIDIRVVRSSFSTVEIPEIGVTITPGAQGEGFISNVEGILDRVLDILDTPSVMEGKGKEAEGLKEKIQAIKDGKMQATLVIEDPTGNSAIISEKAVTHEVQEGS